MCNRCQKLEAYIKKWHWERYWSRLCLMTDMSRWMGHLSPRLSWEEWLNREIEGQ